MPFLPPSLYLPPPPFHLCSYDFTPMALDGFGYFSSLYLFAHGSFDRLFFFSHCSSVINSSVPVPSSLSISQPKSLALGFILLWERISFPDFSSCCCVGTHPQFPSCPCPLSLPPYLKHQVPSEHQHLRCLTISHVWLKPNPLTSS